MTILSRFEKVFLSELELSISRSYEIEKIQLIPGKLTEDIPVFIKEESSQLVMEVYVDVRHPEISKLEELGFTQFLYSLIAKFCHEYLGSTLKEWSPRFFGDGALNLELLAKKRSQFWVLLKSDIGIVHKGGSREVFRSSDVQVVHIGSGDGSQNDRRPLTNARPPRILHVIDDRGGTGLEGYYLRLPDSAYRAYGDLLPACESRGVVWAGNRILYVASDGVSAAFQYEIRVDEVVTAFVGEARRAEGAIQLEQPMQELYEGLYFPIPPALKTFMVPQEEEEIRLELHCDWIDMRTAKHWTPRDASG